MSPITKVVFLSVLALAQCYPRPQGLLQMGLNALGSMIHPGMYGGGVGGMGPMGMGHMGNMGMGNMGYGGMGNMGYGGMGMGGFKDEVKEGPQDIPLPDDSINSAIDAVQKKLEELQPEIEENSRTKREGTESPDQDKVNDTDNSDFSDIEVPDKGPSLSANKDYLLIPIDQSLMFASKFNAANGQKTPNADTIANIPVSGNIAPSEIPNNIYQNNIPNNLNQNQIQQYQNTPNQNQQSFSSRIQPLYTHIQTPLLSNDAKAVPNNLYYVLNPQQNSLPIYNVASNPQNPPLNNNPNVYILQNANQPGGSGLTNNMVPNNVNNQQYFYPVTLSNGRNNLDGQANYILTQPYNNNNFVPNGNQPNSFISVGNQPNNYVPIGNQPKTYVPVVNQPNNYVPVGNQPNTYVPISNLPPNYSVGNQVSYTPVQNQPILTPAGQPSWVLVNQGSNIAPLGNQAMNYGQSTKIPVLLQPSGNGASLLSYKDKEENAD